MGKVGKWFEVVKVVKVIKVGFKVISTRIYKDMAVRWTGGLARTK